MTAVIISVKFIGEDGDPDRAEIPWVKRDVNV